MSFRIQFQDLPHSDRVREDCETRAGALREQFPETTKVEVTLLHNGANHEAHVHVTGKELEMAASGKQHELREAITEAFDRLERQLRKHHQKQIFTRRREGHRDRS